MGVFLCFTPISKQLLNMTYYLGDVLPTKNIYLPLHQQTQSTMNTYTITYNGNASRFKGKTFEVEAINPFDAVKSFYENKVGDLFNQEDGSLKDECGNWVDYGDNWIDYDGGTFKAELLD